MYSAVFKKVIKPTGPFCNSALNIARFQSERPAVILGIESSCDDTGCGIVDTSGNILGEAIHQQHIIHLQNGGIIPPIARDLHKEKITMVCEDALRAAGLKIRDIDAIATTIKPGLPMSLKIGRNFGTYLSMVGNKPFIPIHHMEAHALTIRLTKKVDFPYLALLISGGHCLLAVVGGVDKFYLLGASMDSAPGDILDKFARRLKLHTIPEFSTLSGGQAMEKAASRAQNPEKFVFPPWLTHGRNCDFSFTGLLNTGTRYIQKQEEEYNIKGDALIPDVYDLCAAILMSVAQHLCRKTQRAMEFIDFKNIIPEDKRILVISGGVACNNFIADALNIVCSELNFTLVRTPPKLCTDNGVMVAWNGVERWITNTGIIRDKALMQKLHIEKKAPLGTDWRENVKNANLKCTWIKVEKQMLHRNKSLSEEK